MFDDTRIERFPQRIPQDVCMGIPKLVHKLRGRCFRQAELIKLQVERCPIRR
jgi:hypothetical protein